MTLIWGNSSSFDALIPICVSLHVEVHLKTRVSNHQGALRVVERLQRGMLLLILVDFERSLNVMVYLDLNRLVRPSILQNWLRIKAIEESCLLPDCKKLFFRAVQTSL